MVQIDYASEELKIFIEIGKGESKLLKKFMSNATLMRDLQMAINSIKSLDNIGDLRKFKRFNYEPLHYGREGQSSIRIGFKTKYRLIFEEYEDGIRICVIEISEHYGDK